MDPAESTGRSEHPLRIPLSAGADLSDPLAERFDNDGAPRQEPTWPPAPDPLAPSLNVVGARPVPCFSDALGHRFLLLDDADGPSLELLRLHRRLCEAPRFETLLRERVEQLASFTDSRFARVRRVERVRDPDGGLALVSEHVEGRRLSDVLELARRGRVDLPADVALGAVKELAAALAALHALGPAIAHGVLGPERIVVSSEGRLVVTEHVLGLALGHAVQADRALRSELRLSVTRNRPLDRPSDVRGFGLTAVALVLGRPLVEEDTPLGEVEERVRAAGWDRQRSAALGRWLVRALLAGGRGGFASAVEASTVLDALVPSSSAPTAAMARFLVECCGTAPLVGASSASRAGNGNTEDPAVAPTPAIAPPAVREDVGSDDSQVVPDAPLLAFNPETVGGAPHDADDERRAGGTSRERRARWPLSPHTARLQSALGPARKWALPAMLAVLIVGGLYLGTWLLPTEPAPQREPATLRLESNPAGAAVTVDGTPAGLTPTELPLAPGRHTVLLAVGERRRSIVVTLAEGAQASQFVELPPAVATVGSMDVRSEPVGARVIVDGVPRGVTPVLLAGLSAGAHDVRVELRGQSVAQSVEVESGGTSSVVVPFGRGESRAPGWLSIASPIELQIFEGAELLGTSATQRIMLPAGRHTLRLVNDGVGFEASELADVPAGGNAKISVSVPTGTIDINASPWAAVSIDGQAVGETPLAGIPVRLGRHRVTFTHPTLGQRVVECLVTLRQPARVSADLRK